MSDLFGEGDASFVKEVGTDILLAWVCGEISLTPLRLKEVLNLYDNSLFEAVTDNFNKFDKSKNRWLQKWNGLDKKNRLDKFVQNLKDSEVSVVSCLSEKYPKRLKILSDYPLILYYQGNLDLLNKTEVITVVGARNYTKYAEILLNKILSPVCCAGVGVVSGLALGIDGLSHQAALKNNSFTIAVIGSGLDDKSFYPMHNLSLKKEILQKGGLVMSEYAPGTEATNFYFPQRNRILAALSELIWVVQAAIKSGSLITSSVARDLGKTVATTPGSIFEATLAGNLKLIKDGASLVTEPEDIFTLLGLKVHPEIITQKVVEFASEDEKKVFEVLSLTPKLVDKIALELKINIVELNSLLTMLELAGLACSVGDNLWIRK